MKKEEEVKKEHHNECYFCGWTKAEVKKLQEAGDKSGCPGCVYCRSDNKECCNNGIHKFYY